MTVQDNTARLGRALVGVVAAEFISANEGIGFLISAILIFFIPIVPWFWLLARSRGRRDTHRARLSHRHLCEHYGSVPSLR